jgi:hypothetical protein
LINRVVILNFKNHRFATDPGWGESLQRIHLGRTRKEDVEKINWTARDFYLIMVLSLYTGIQART